LWIGQAISNIGSHITFVAVPYQIFRITHSTLAVGLIGLVELIPLLLLSVVGGAMADAIDRRRLLLITDALAAVTVGLLAAHAALPFVEQHLWIIYVLVAIAAAVYALGSPALRSATPILLPREQITAASALDFIQHNTTALAGPAAAGLLIASIGLPGTYALDAVSFLGSIACTFMIRPIPPAANADKVSLRSVKEGFRYLRGRPVLQGAFIVDLYAMILGLPNALFPAIAAGLGGGPQVLGLLYAAPSAGSVLATITSGWTKTTRRQGRVVYAATIAWGASLIGLAAADVVWVALLALVCAGASDTISGVFREAILQTTTPEHMLGRMHGVGMTVYTSGPSLGDIEAGALAAATSVPFAILFGGIGCIVCVGLQALLLPEFGRYDSANPAG
jgi:MFS family permease